MKPDRPVKKATTNLDVLRFPKPIAELGEMNCPYCSGPLLMSQPDLDSPERLLGVCRLCSHWFLLDLIPNLDEGILSKLPELQVIRELRYKDPVDGIAMLSSYLEKI